MLPTPMECIDDTNLLAFGNGTLDSDAWQKIDAHVRDCSSCQQRVQQLISALAPTQAARPGSDTRVTRAPPAPPSGALPRGTCVGRYVLLERLGAGGMGEVYVTYDPQLDRRVALKLLRPGVLGAEEGKARLLREAQAMARLAHPNVIAVHDAGTFEDRVFIAMELVEGTTLDRWLRQPRPWQEILERFIAAGRGLSAAHAAGLVHRDFKPDNVLVGTDGRVRVLDFGLARPAGAAGEQAPDSRAPIELDGNLSSGMLNNPLTQAGTVLGTPAYMAPEQIEGTRTDARTDQFSFCVALHEALYGRRPFIGDTFMDMVAAMLRPVPDPPRDSRVPAWIHRILARGLSRHADARFPSMDALLAELSRDPRGQRRRALAAATLLVLLGTGLGGYALQARHQRTACQGTELPLAGVWDAARQDAIHQAFLATRKPFAEDAWSRARAMLDDYINAWVAMSTESCEATRVRHQQPEEAFALRHACLDGRLQAVKVLTGLFGQPDADVMTNSVSAIQALQPLGECADVATLAARAALEDPALRGKTQEIRASLTEASVMLNAGKYRTGVKPARQAIASAHALRHRSLEAEGFLLLGKLQDRAEEPAQAVASFREAIWAAEAARRDEISARAWSRLLKLVGSLEQHPEQAAESVRFARAALERVGRNTDLEADLENSEGALAAQTQKNEDALAHFRKALELRQTSLGPEHPEVAWALNNVGLAERRLGRYDDAITHNLQALRILEKAFGPKHPNVASPLLNLGIIYTRMGRYEEALPYCRRALEVREQALEPGNPDLIPTVQALALADVRTGKLETAIGEYERLLQLRRTAYGPNHPLVADGLRNLAAFLAGQREYQKAIPFLEQEVGILEKVKVASLLAGALDSLGAAYTGAGDYAQAGESLTRALGLWEKNGTETPGMARCLDHRGDLLLAQRHPDQALEHYQRALELRQRMQGPTQAGLAADLLGIGRAWLALRHPDRATPVLERAVQLRTSQQLREADPNALAELAQTRFALATAIWNSRGDRARSLELAAQALEGYAAAGPRYQDERETLAQWQAERSGARPTRSKDPGLPKPRKPPRRGAPAAAPP